MSSSLLPVEEIIPSLLNQLHDGDAIVIAPPGAGKSTCIPLHLLALQQFKSKKIIMLQPRRVAAKTVAEYLSKQLKEPLGKTIGYRIRGESKVSLHTRLEVVTEGVLTRMIQDNPELSNIGIIIFDEFHERSLHADFSLALSLELKEAFNEQLRLLIMSATLDIDDIKKIMPKATVFSSKGRSYPVNIQYRPSINKQIKLVEQVSEIIKEAYSKHIKDILVFLPGTYEINKLSHLFEGYWSDLMVLPLHASLKKQAQAEALQAAPVGMRKLILSTNIAETSLTIDGIEVVIDSGLEKSSRFDLRLGVTQLLTQRISQASAEQRSGRAGRLMPGTCYRLWNEELHFRLAKKHPAEILTTDISGITLEAKAWGSNLAQLSLIDLPSQTQQAHANKQLLKLGLIDESGKLTGLGTKAQQLGTNPDVAVMLLKAQAISVAHLSMACALCALLESKDPLIHASTPLLEDRFNFLLANKQNEIWKLITQWHQRFNITLQTWPLDELAVIVGLGFPLWIAKKRVAQNYTMANGSGASMHSKVSESAIITSAKWISIASLQVIGSNANNTVIKYAQPITIEQLEKHFSKHFSVEEALYWDEQKQKISAIEQRKFNAIKVSHQNKSISPSTSMVTIWQRLLTERGIGFIPFDKHAKNFIQRVNMLSSIEADFPLLSDANLIKYADQWLLPALEKQLNLKA